MSHLHAGVAFWWIAHRDGFIIYIGIINCAIGVDGDGWISALLLRNRARNSELRPCGGRSRAEGAALFATALIDRKPNCAIRRDMEMSMQAPASGGRTAIVRWRSHRCVAHPQVIAALTGGGSNDVLRAIVNGLSLISRVTESAECRRIRSRTNRLVIGATIRWRGACRQPVVAVIQTRRCAVSESVSNIGAGS